MSRLGKIPVAIPEKVTANLAGDEIKVKGPLGELSLKVHPLVEVAVEEKAVLVKRKANDKQSKSMHGTTRAHIANMMEGVTKGYQKILEINGVGWSGQVQGKELKLILGFSHPVVFPIPDGIKVETPNPQTMVVSGADKHTVGQLCAKIRAARPAEPYNLKGVKYRDEVIRRKAGKTFVTGAS